MRNKTVLLIVAACMGALLTYVGSMFYKGRTDFSFATLLGYKSQKSSIALACVPGKDTEEIYFVSCGGTF